MKKWSKRMKDDRKNIKSKRWRKKQKMIGRNIKKTIKTKRIHDQREELMIEKKIVNGEGKTKN